MALLQTKMGQVMRLKMYIQSEYKRLEMDAATAMTSLENIACVERNSQIPDHVMVDTPQSSLLMANPSLSTALIDPLLTSEITSMDVTLAPYVEEQSASSDSESLCGSLPDLETSSEPEGFDFTLAKAHEAAVYINGDNNNPFPFEFPIHSLGN